MRWFACGELASRWRQSKVTTRQRAPTLLTSNGMRSWILVYACVDVRPKTLRVNRGRVRERFVNSEVGTNALRRTSMALANAAAVSREHLL
jgi:hypothetical protein